MLPLVIFSTYTSTMNMETVRSSETSLGFSGKTVTGFLKLLMHVKTMTAD
jgi:hypothetical protein